MQNIGIEAKTSIYKTAVRLIITCTAETKPEASKTKRLLVITEIKVLRKINGKILLDGERRETRVTKEEKEDL